MAIAQTAESEFLVSEEVQQLLRISDFTLKKLQKSGLPYYKFDRKKVFKRSDIDEFMKSKMVRSAAAA